MFAAGLGWRDGSPAAPSYDQGTPEEAVAGDRRCCSTRGLDINADQRQRRHRAARRGDQSRRARDRAVPRRARRQAEGAEQARARRRSRRRWPAARTWATSSRSCAPPNRNEADRRVPRSCWGRWCGSGSSMSAQDGARPASAPAPAGSSLRRSSAPTVPAATTAACDRRPARCSSRSMPATDRRAAGLWARAYRQLQAGAMPPVGAPRPDRATTDAALAAIEHALGGEPRARRRRRARRSPRAWRACCGTARLMPRFWREAQRGRLRDPAAVERQVRRMLADDRARAFVARFFFPWLQLDELAKADPDPKLFPRLRRVAARCPRDGDRAVPAQSTA